MLFFYRTKGRTNASPSFNTSRRLSVLGYFARVHHAQLHRTLIHHEFSFRMCGHLHELRFHSPSYLPAFSQHVRTRLAMIVANIGR